jgi:hypothetical protein
MNEEIEKQTVFVLEDDNEVMTAALKDKSGSRELAFDESGRCKKCGSKVSFADVTDTLVFVGDEIVKRYDGDIINRNCVRCTYPKQYPDYEDYDRR